MGTETPPLGFVSVGGRIFIEGIQGMSGNLISEYRVLFHRKWNVTRELRFPGSDDHSSLLLWVCPFVYFLAHLFLIFPRLLRHSSLIWGFDLPWCCVCLNAHVAEGSSAQYEQLQSLYFVSPSEMGISSWLSLNQVSTSGSISYSQESRVI